MASKSVIFKGTLSMLHRTALNLEQFSFPTSFGKRFETVRDDLGSLLGWFGKAKIVISLRTSWKIRFSDDELRKHVFEAVLGGTWSLVQESL